MAKRLGLKKSQSSVLGFRPWSDEEWLKLEHNMHLSVVEQQATLLPDRTVRAVEKVRTFTEEKTVTSITLLAAG